MLKIGFDCFGSRRVRTFAVALFASVCVQATAGVVSSDLNVELTTDKACYSPGQTVSFKVTSGDVPANTIIRYRHGSTVVDENTLAGGTTGWTWTAPQGDFKGYMVDLYQKNGNDERIIGTIAVDVSSDWTRFPRYGFVADFEEYGDSEAKTARIYSEMEYLNRCHINGVQFQDWQWMHHYPVCFESDGKTLKNWYQDVSNRYVGIQHIKKYIDVQHSYGMKSIFYNLCFGAWKDAKNDGVKDEWGLYTYNEQGNRYQDFHGLPDDWQSNIYLENPANTEWQQYMAARNTEVYSNFAFDGYQIDQLGGRGDRFDSDNNPVDLPAGYASFIEAMKAAHPDKRLIMNAVSGYGAENILGTGKMDFCYNEVWGNGNGYGGVSEDAFANLYEIIKNNDRFSDHKLRTVYAAYMNYKKAGQDYIPENERFMNTPGVLLTDAVMFALGGSHLELGDHMLSREYFPAAPLAMTDELKTAMIRYYDFITAYQNLLRESSSRADYTASVSTSGDVSICAWPPQLDHVVTFAKSVGTSKVVHFLNFKGINDNLSWRDEWGTRPKPTTITSLPVSVVMPQTVSKVWVASPDAHGGALQELSFEQNGANVTFTLPSLEYWTMVVFECADYDLRIVGEATATGWDAGKATVMQSNEDGSVFTAAIHLEAGEGKTFKFINGTDYGTCMHYNAEYDKYNFNEEWNINTAGIKANTDADFKGGANDYQFTVAETGDYLITVDLKNMIVKVDKAKGEIVTIGATGYATYCSGNALDFTGIDGLKAYMPTSTIDADDDVLRLCVGEPMTSVCEATGLLLYGTPGTYDVPFAYNGCTSSPDNLLVGVTEDTQIQLEADGKKNFILANGENGVAFYPAKEGTLAGNKAYLSLPATDVANAKAIVIDFGGTTAVNGITARGGEADSPFYTIAGVRVERPQTPGLYIHNGRKVVLK